MKQRDFSLDILKILGACGIVFLHYQQFSGTHFENGFNFYGGSIEWSWSVELFFVISGMNACHSSKMGGSCREFIKRKWIRLVPMAAISFFLFQIGILLFEILSKKTTFNYEGMSVKTILSPWRFLLSGLGIQAGWGFRAGAYTPDWYVSVLLICYLQLFFLNWMARQLKISVDIGYVVAIIVGISAVQEEWEMPFVNTWSGRGMLSFFMGVLFMKYIYRRRTSSHFSLGNMVCILAVSFAMIDAYFLDGRLLFYGEIPYGGIFFLVFVLYPSIMILMKPLNFLQSKTVTLLSKSSYDVFIFHFPLIAFVVDASYVWSIPIHSRWFMFLFLIVAWVVGILLHCFVEEKIQAFVKSRIDLLFLDNCKGEC